MSKSSGAGHSKGVKRNLDSEDSDASLNNASQLSCRQRVKKDSEDSGTKLRQGTPTKDSQRSDGHFCSPVKDRLDFTCWKTSKPESPTVASQVVSQTKIMEIQVGKRLTDSLRFRVTFKHLKTSKAGKVLNFHGLDATGEVAFTAFRDIAEKYDHIIEVNVLYELKHFTVKEESLQFRSGTGHQLQIILDAKSQLVQLKQDNDLPPIPFDFHEIGNIHEMAVASRTDILGILVQDWGIESIVSGESILTKRDVSLTDLSKSMVTLTMWGSMAENFSGEPSTVIAIRKGMVSEYNNKKSLNCTFDTLVWVDPLLDEKVNLREWWSATEQERIGN